MFFNVAVRSAWHHKRLLIIVLLASWLFTGFCALVPLFLGTFSEAISRRIVDDVRPEMTTLAMSNPRPFAPDTLALVDRELGDMITAHVAFSRAIGNAGYPQLGKICGYDYARGELLTALSRYAVTTSDHCYKIYSFATPSDLFQLAEGRWPQALPIEPLASPLRMDAPQLEAAITREIAATAKIEIGDRLVVGDDPQRALVVEIVGLLEPLRPPDDVFWHGHSAVQIGEWTTYGDDMRFDLGLIVPNEAFESWILPRYAPPYVIFHWWMSTDPKAINRDTLKTLGAHLSRVEREMLASNPQVEVVSGLKAIADQYETETTRFERVVWVLAGTVLVLMVFQIVVIVRLALLEVGREQAVITSRGASVRQRVAIRAALIGGAVFTSVLVGPVLARAAMNLFQHVGPLAVLRQEEIPSLADSLVGTLASAGGLGLLLVGVAGYTAQFPRTHSRLRGPDRPFWRRHFLDLLFLAIGLAFMLRLTFSATGDLRQSIEALWRPSEGYTATVEGGLGDPINMIGPVLILVGCALLWLRIFSWLVRLAAPVFRRHKGLLIPLTAWQTGRSVGQHAPLVMMLMAAMMLAVASLGLDSTYDRRAHRIAQTETGADVRLEIDPMGADEQTLPRVSSSISVMRLEAAAQTVLMGIDPDRSFPGLAEAAGCLAGQTADLPGWPLPPDTAALQLQIFTPQEAHTTTTTQLDVQLVDGQGVQFAVPMAAAETVVRGRFISYRAALPVGPAPWRLIGFRFRTEREGVSMFSHQIYLDDLAVISAQGTATVLEDFEQETAVEPWQGAISQSDTAVEAVRSREQAASGVASLSVDYRIRYAQVREFLPLLMVHEVAFPQIPLVVSEAFADWQKRQSGTEQDLAVGDVGRMQLELAGEYVQFSYRVVGIVQEFPTAKATDRLMVAPFHDLQVVLNTQSKTGRHYDVNQVWLALDTARPGADFRQSAASLANVAHVAYAWDRYDALRRDPVLKAVTGILFAAFWFVWGLYAVYTGARLAGIEAQRDTSWHLLRVLGLDRRRLRRLAAAQQLILLVPALALGALVSVLLVDRLLPFLAVIESGRLTLSPGAAASVLFMTLLLILPVMASLWVKTPSDR